MLCIYTAVIISAGYTLYRNFSKQDFVIDTSTAKGIGDITVGNKAHGVVISADGKTVYVTNSMDNTVSVISVARQQVIRTIPVGKGSNCISHWFETGGMP